MYKIILGILLLIPFLRSSGQDYERIRMEMDSIYQANITKTRINGVYIPASFEEAFDELDALSEPEARNKFRDAEEEWVARRLHFGLGKWMRVNWNFDEGSRLSAKMRELGIHHPDDMVNFMLRSYHRHLNNEPQEMKARAQAYVEYRKNKIQKELKEKFEKGSAPDSTANSAPGNKGY